MANSFGADILVQARDPKYAALFYVKQLGFEITGETPDLISLKGKSINLFIERGPALGPVLEVTVDDVEEAKRRLVKSGCEIIKDEPEFPRCYVKDPFGLIYNLTRWSVTPQHGVNPMTAFNAVRFRVKLGCDQEFLDAQKKMAADWPGLRHVNLIKTADRNYCIIAEWTDMDALAKARPSMIATLDSFRDTLEDLGSGLGITDPVSGPVVLELK